MRSLKYPFAGLSIAIAISACADASATDLAAREALKRDLQLASTATMSLAAPQVDAALLTLEGRPQATPEQTTTLRRGAGSRAVRSKTPTVRATPEVEVAAAEEVSVTETLAEAPMPDVSEPVAVVPRSAPVVIPAGDAGDYGTGSGGGVLGGGMGGVVIRGGGVDGDNCELHRTGRRRGPMIIPNNPIPPQIGGAVIGSVYGGGYPRSTGARRAGSGGVASAPTRASTSARPSIGGSRVRGR